MCAQTIKIFDTTLRDGQQCPGAGMSLEKNIEYAQLAKKVGVDILEAGFPAASQLDFEIVRNISNEFCNDNDNPTIAALSQLREAQIDITIKALSPLIKNKKGRLHIYVPVDPHLMEASLGKYANQKSNIIDDLFQCIKKTTNEGLEVEFSPEGYSRMGDNFDFVTDTIRAAVSAGASVINCPDTIGGAYRLEDDDYFVEKMKRHQKIIHTEFPDKNITWSVHCHNDFGLALDNTMNAIFHGPARQIEGCFNGIGERAGNVSLEQCILLIKYFGSNNITQQRFSTSIHCEYLQEISDFIASYMLPRQPHWPVIGENAAKHSSGGHTNAILKNACAYQPFNPSDVGKEISFVFGPLSGSNHAKNIIENHGYLCSNNEKQTIAQHIKNYYKNRRKGITDNELMACYFEYRSPMNIKKFNYKKNEKTNILEMQGHFFELSPSFDIEYEGDDSVLTALNKAIEKYLPGIVIKHYQSSSIEEGITAKSRSHIFIIYKNKEYKGIGEDQDIEISALKALINAGNRAYINEHYSIKQEKTGEAR